jgi:diguanylate cyclase (GGDEF)-like protein
VTTPSRTPLDTTPPGLLRLYYRIVLGVVAVVLLLNVALRVLLGTGLNVTPQRISLYAAILLLSWFGHELVRETDGTHKEPRGLYLGLMGLLLVVLCVETGGLASPYFMLVFSTCVFGALLMAPMKAVLLTSVLAAAYCFTAWLYPSSGGLLDGGIASFAAALRSGRAARAEEVTAMVIHCGFFYVGAYIAMRLTVGFREKVVRLETHATRDPLTGLPNRRGFTEKLDLEIERALQWDWPIAMLVADLDHFKRVNDKFGHPVGDAVLAVAAQLLREAAGPLDHLSRLGGEEFAVAAVGADVRAGGDLADRIVRTFRNHPWDRVNEGLRVTVSVGVAILQPSLNTGGKPDLGQLIDTADRALLQVKQNGRDGYLLAGDLPGRHAAPPAMRPPGDARDGGPSDDHRRLIRH